MELRLGSYSACVQKLYTQLEAHLPTGCGWSQTYQEDDAEYLVDAIVVKFQLGLAKPREALNYK